MYKRNFMMIRKKVPGTVLWRSNQKNKHHKNFNKTKKNRKDSHRSMTLAKRNSRARAQS